MVTWLAPAAALARGGALRLPATKPAVLRAVRRDGQRRLLSGRAGAGGGATAPRVALLAEASAESGAKPRIVFLGSPDCVCSVLQTLADASASPDAPYELCAVVTQPPKRVRNKAEVKTPVHELAESLGVERIWTPGKAKDEEFLSALEALAPDVCITAAYGQYLPKRFLEAPRLGTLNLHPSLLPRWRGASPVQRSLVEGDEETGITILYTVAKMDAGPIVLQRSMPLVGDETSEGLLDHFFKWGAQLLRDEALPAVLDGSVTMETAQVQDEALVTKAGLISKEEGRLWPHNETALEMRNKIRGFTPWPGTTLPVACSGSKAAPEGYRVIVSEAEVMPLADVPLEEGEERPPLQELLLIPGVNRKPPRVGLRPAADPENVLVLGQFQLPGKKQGPAKTFAQGYMKTQPARWMTPEEEVELTKKSGGVVRKAKKVRRS